MRTGVSLAPGWPWGASLGGVIAVAIVVSGNSDSGEGGRDGQTGGPGGRAAGGRQRVQGAPGYAVVNEIRRHRDERRQTRQSYEKRGAELRGFL